MNILTGVKLTGRKRAPHVERRPIPVIVLALLLAGGAGALLSGTAGAAEPPHGEGAAAPPAITVYKTPSCGCCAKWVDHLQRSGLEVNVVMVNETYSVRSQHGVPNELGSCHTAIAGNYWVEGHVPADVIRQLLQEQPGDIEGIAVPGMVPGSPGMEGPNPQRYQVLSVDDQGGVAVYATRQGKTAK